MADQETTTRRGDTGEGAREGDAAGARDRAGEETSARDRARDGDETSARNRARDGDDTAVSRPKVSFVAVVRRSVREFRRKILTDLAAGLTYYGLLSVVPALIVLFSILGILGRENAQAVVSQAQQLAPGSAAEVVRTLVEQAQGNRTGAGFAAVIGIVVGLWSASGYVAAFMRASNAIYGIPEGRPIWKTVPIRVGVTVLALVVITIAAAIVVLSGPVARHVGDLIGLGDTAVLVWSIVKWPVLVLLVSGYLAILYWAAPNARRRRIRWLSPGGIVAVLLWVIVSAGFSLYVVFSSSYAKTYGSLAGVVIFMVWLWLTNVAILLGAEVDAEVDRDRAISAGLPDRVEPFAEPRDTRTMDERDRLAVQEAEQQRGR